MATRRTATWVAMVAAVMLLAAVSALQGVAQAGQPAAGQSGATEAWGDKSPVVLKVGSTAPPQSHYWVGMRVMASHRRGHDQGAVQVRGVSQLPNRRRARSGRRREAGHYEAHHDLNRPPVGLQPADETGGPALPVHQHAAGLQGLWTAPSAARSWPSSRSRVLYERGLVRKRIPAAHRTPSEW